MLPDFDETLAYLEARYLTLDGLAEASGLSASRLEALIAAGCLPPHSHEAAMSLRVATRVYGARATAEKRVRFYHPDLAPMAIEADRLAVAEGLAAAGETLRAQHAAAIADATGFAPGSAEHLAMADDHWAAWRDGTHGVCLQRFRAEDMVHKTAAVQAMEAALAAATEQAPIDAPALDLAVKAYAAVTGPFGPHERPVSTRARIYEPALALSRSLPPD